MAVARGRDGRLDNPQAGAILRAGLRAQGTGSSRPTSQTHQVLLSDAEAVVPSSDSSSTSSSSPTIAVMIWAAMI